MSSPAHACAQAADAAVIFIHDSGNGALTRRLARDVIRHHASHEIAVFQVVEADSLQQGRQFARLVEVMDRAREIADAELDELGGAAGSRFVQRGSPWSRER